jgi:hypothetical protein
MVEARLASLEGLPSRRKDEGCRAAAGIRRTIGECGAREFRFDRRHAEARA